MVWTDEAAEQRCEEPETRRERVSRKKITVREKVAKLRSTLFSQCFAGGRKMSKSRLPKVAGAEPFSQMRDLKLQADVARKRL